MANEIGGIEVIGNPFSPDVFADEAIAFDFINGTVRITFAVAKASEPAPPAANQLVQVGRLIMTTQGAQTLSLALHDYLLKIGLDPSSAMRGGETPQ